MANHVLQVVDDVVSLITSELPLIVVYENEADAIDYQGDSVCVFFVSNETDVEDQQRFRPTHGYERTTISIVARADVDSIKQSDAIEILSSVQGKIYNSQYIDEKYHSIKRSSMTCSREPRSEGMSFFAEQTYVFEYLTQDNDPETIK
jgi:hypothetical protein